jgi:hypothetical protein
MEQANIMKVACIYFLVFICTYALVTHLNIAQLCLRTKNLFSYDICSV